MKKSDVIKYLNNAKKRIKKKDKSYTEKQMLLSILKNAILVLKEGL